MDFGRWVLILLLSTFSPEGYAPWTGPVVAVVRPDEIRVEKAPGRVESVRLYGIDSPLEPQPFAPQALRYVSGRVLGRLVVVQPLPGNIAGPWYNPTVQRYDRYHRIIALVTIDGESLNKELLTKGVARWYRPYVPFERGFKRLEDLAREANEGMWAKANPIPSWVFQGAPIYKVQPFQDSAVAEPASSTGPQPITAPQEDQSAKDKAGMHPQEAIANHVPVVQEGPPDEAAQKPCPDDYEPRLKRAYRTIAAAAATHLYVCRQIANDWKSRQSLLTAYAQTGQNESETEEILKEAADPCPRYADAYENVQRLWTMCTELGRLRSEPAGDPALFTEKLEVLSADYRAVVTKMTQRFGW